MVLGSELSWKETKAKGTLAHLLDYELGLPIHHCVERVCYPNDCDPKRCEKGESLTYTLT